MSTRLRILIISSVAAPVFFLIAMAWLFHSCDRRRGDYHQCEENRMTLDQARYWYALENNMTCPPPLVKEMLTPYVPGEKTFACPGGGTYSVSSLNQYVVCSIPEHMFDTCKGNSPPPIPIKPHLWTEEFPLDYLNSDHWRGRLDDAKDGTIFRLSGAIIIFKGLHGWNLGDLGEIRFSGRGSHSGKTEFPGGVKTYSYKNEVCTLTFAGHVLRITNKGRTLEVDKIAFDLPTTRPTIIVEVDGTMRIK